MKVLVAVSIDEEVVAQGIVDDVMIPAWSDYAQQLSDKKGKDTSLAVIQPQKMFTFAPGGASDKPQVVEYPQTTKRRGSMPKRAVLAHVPNKPALKFQRAESSASIPTKAGVRTEGPPKQGESPSVCEITNRGD